MIKRNENRPGYKKTPIGWIPENWKCDKFINFASLQRGFDLPKDRRQQGVIPVFASNGLVGYHNNAKFYGPGIVTGRSGSVGKVTFIENDFWPLNTTLYVKNFHKNNKRFVYYFLSNFRLERFANGTGVPTLNRNDIHPRLISFPQIEEQNKIVDILFVWDNAIEKTKNLITAKIKLKKGLMQQLLTGRYRFPKFGPSIKKSGGIPNGWKLSKISEFYKIKSQKNHPNEPILSVTQDAGVIQRDGYDRKINQENTNSNSYKLVEPGDFIISLRSFQGGLELSKIKGVISPAYHVISSSKDISTEFHKHYFKSDRFIKQLRVSIIGIRDGKQVNLPDFFNMKILVPTEDEQKCIAGILSAIDKEIGLLEKELSILVKQKNGMMQKLLTGEVRHLDFIKKQITKEATK